MRKTKHSIRVLAVAFAVFAGFVVIGGPGQTPVPEPTRPGESILAPLSMPETSRTFGTVIASDDDEGISYSSDTQPPLTVAKNLPAPDKQKKPPRTGEYVTIEDKAYPVQTYELFASPNDPSANQWWVTNSRLSQSWDLPSAANPTTIAIIDTGFAIQHEEFTGRWDSNAGESGVVNNEGASSLNCTSRSLPLDASCNLIDDNGDTIVDNESGSVSEQNPSFLNCTAQNKPLDKSCNRLDDDGNGFVDDTLGWDFVNYDSSVQAGQTNPNGTGTAHGTMVTGVAAANANNGKGLAGANWSAKILPIQAIDDNGYGDTVTVGNSIYYAINRGVDVISLSLGTSAADAYVQEAIEAATKAGIVVVASSGNDGCDCLAYPARYGEVLAVGAIDTSGARASFSSYGSELDIVAPGTSIATSTWAASNQTGAYVSGVAGTSFSAPLVAGLVATLRANEPTATPLQIISLLTEQSNRQSIPAGSLRTNTSGYGQLDAYAAASRSQSTRQITQLYALTPVSLGNYLTPLQPVETIAPAVLYDCQGQIATTPIYELSRGSDRFYSVSRTEQRMATGQGYSATRFSYGCMTQPQDNASVYRYIDIPREFRNVYDKL